MMQRIRDWAHRDPNTPPGYRGRNREGAHDWSPVEGDYGRDLDLDSRMRDDYRMNSRYPENGLRDREYEMSRHREFGGYGAPRSYGRNEFDRPLDPYEQRRYERERALYDSENDREWRRR